ncbi:MAG: hypothetical protein R2847_02010 [Bacteroidia bacterium]
MLRFAVVPGHALLGIPVNGIVTACVGGAVLTLNVAVPDTLVDGLLGQVLSAILVSV